MNDFTGRRSNDRAKRFGKSFLEGLSALGTAMADAPRRARIEEIDLQVKNLLQERDHLVAAMIEPGDLTVSESYDPYWRKPADDDDEPIRADVSVEGRLTECKGRTTMSTYHGAHPGCPYVDKIHNAHEFTLRD